MGVFFVPELMNFNNSNNSIMYFRLLKNKSKEHTTTESNSLKDGDNQCNNIEREGNSAAVIILITATIAVIIVTAVFSIVIYRKMKGHTCNKCTFGRRRNKDTLGK